MGVGAGCGSWKGRMMDGGGGGRLSTPVLAGRCQAVGKGTRSHRSGCTTSRLHRMPTHGIRFNPNSRACDGGAAVGTSMDEERLHSPPLAPLPARPAPMDRSTDQASPQTPTSIHMHTPSPTTDGSHALRREGDGLLGAALQAHAPLVGQGHAQGRGGARLQARQEGPHALPGTQLIDGCCCWGIGVGRSVGGLRVRVWVPV